MGIPYVPGSETSRAAAESMRSTAQPFAERLWRYILEQGTHGATADDLMRTFPTAMPSTITARMRALKCSGLVTRHAGGIVRHTRTGRMAEVWVGVPGDFSACYSEPAGNTVRSAILRAAREYAESPDDATLNALVDAAWDAYGSGQRPRHVRGQTQTTYLVTDRIKTDACYGATVQSPIAMGESMLFPLDSPTGKGAKRDG